jgi:hypothetical protein
MLASQFIDPTLIMLSLFATKHMIVDGPLQSSSPYQWANKGTYGHPGGILHAGLHGIGTFVSMLIMSFFVNDLSFEGFSMEWFGPWVVLMIVCSIADFLIHYHVDWLKMTLNRIFGWTTASPSFWTAVMGDQYAHSMTYLGLVWFISTHIQWALGVYQWIIAL